MITTVQKHLLQQEQELLKSTWRQATGTVSWLLSGITLAAKGADREFEIMREGIHQRTPFCVGSRREMQALVAAVKG